MVECNQVDRGILRGVADMWVLGWVPERVPKLSTLDSFLMIQTFQEFVVRRTEAMCKISENQMMSSTSGFGRFY